MQERFPSSHTRTYVAGSMTSFTASRSAGVLAGLNKLTATVHAALTISPSRPALIPSQGSFPLATSSVTTSTPAANPVAAPAADMRFHSKLTSTTGRSCARP